MCSKEWKYEGRIFVDLSGEELIVKNRKSAVFFQRLADVEKPNSYYVKNAKNRFGEQHKDYVCESELGFSYNFSDEDFKVFCDYCNSIANESWANFSPKKTDSLSAEYDDYYDREFDNNGSLKIRKNRMKIEGPYGQPKSNGEIVRLIKFNKRKFESFMFDLNNLAWWTVRKNYEQERMKINDNRTLFKNEKWRQKLNWNSEGKPPEWRNCLYIGIRLSMLFKKVATW